MGDKLYFTCNEKNIEVNIEKKTTCLTNYAKVKILSEINFETLPNKIEQEMNTEIKLNKLLLQLATIDIILKWNLIIDKKPEIYMTNDKKNDENKKKFTKIGNIKNNDHKIEMRQQDNLGHSILMENIRNNRKYSIQEFLEKYKPNKQKKISKQI